MAVREKFVGHRGTEIGEDERGDIHLKHWRAGRNALEIEFVQDLREYFQHERDQELGRWRSQEDADFVAYPIDGGKRILVVNEANGSHEAYTRRIAGNFPTNRHSQVAEEYYTAHPEPKPWHEAKPGEVWHLLTKGVDDAVNDSVWFVSHSPQQGSIFRPTVACSVDFLGVKATAICSARRIWPEVS